jgi:outer membrane protein assembly factor BamB
LGQPVATDIDGDGTVEVLVGDEGGSLYCLDGLEGKVKWRFYAEGSIYATVTLADVNGDGKLEVFLGTQADEAHVISLNPDGSVRWKFAYYGYQMSIPSFGGIVVDDLDEDGKNEVVVGAMNRTVLPPQSEIICVNDDGTLKWRRKVPSFVDDVTPAVEDLNGDGVKEVLMGSSDGMVYCVNGGDGSIEWTFKVASPGTSVVINDVDGDGAYEILTVGGRNVYCLTSDGSLKWERSTDGYSDSLVAVQGEIFTVMSDQNFYRISPNGSLIDRRFVNGYGGFLTASDLNSDGLAEVVLPMSTPEVSVVCIAHNGEVLWKAYPHSNCQGIADAGIAAVDVDRDGYIELLGACYDGYVFCIDGEYEPYRYGVTLWVALDVPFNMGEVITLLVDVLDYGSFRPVAGKMVKFYVNGNLVGYNSTEAEGKSIFKFKPEDWGNFTVIASVEASTGDTIAIRVLKPRVAQRIVLRESHLKGNSSLFDPGEVLEACAQFSVLETGMPLAEANASWVLLNEEGIPIIEVVGLSDHKGWFNYTLKSPIDIGSKFRVESILHSYRGKPLPSTREVECYVTGLSVSECALRYPSVNESVITIKLVYAHDGSPAAGAKVGLNGIGFAQANELGHAVMVLKELRSDVTGKLTLYGLLDPYGVVTKCRNITLCAAQFRILDAMGYPLFEEVRVVVKKEQTIELIPDEAGFTPILVYHPVIHELEVYWGELPVGEVEVDLAKSQREEVRTRVWKIEKFVVASNIEDATYEWDEGRRVLTAKVAGLTGEVEVWFRAQLGAEVLWRVSVDGSILQEVASKEELRRFRSAFYYDKASGLLLVRIVAWKEELKLTIELYEFWTEMLRMMITALSISLLVVFIAFVLYRYRKAA